MCTSPATNGAWQRASYWPGNKYGLAFPPVARDWDGKPLGYSHTLRAQRQKHCSVEQTSTGQILPHSDNQAEPRSKGVCRARSLQQDFTTLVRWYRKKKCLKRKDSMFNFFICLLWQASHGICKSYTESSAWLILAKKAQEENQACSALSAAAENP